LFADEPGAGEVDSGWRLYPLKRKADGGGLGPGWRVEFRLGRRLGRLLARAVIARQRISNNRVFFMLPPEPALETTPRCCSVDGTK